jgi:hypothetical protein
MRGSTVEALGCFIGAGTGEGVGSGARACSGAPGKGRTCGGFVSALVQTPVGRPNVHILPTILCIVSSLCQGLSVVCEFRVEIWSGWEDMVV